MERRHFLIHSLQGLALILVGWRHSRHPRVGCVQPLRRDRGRNSCGGEDANDEAAYRVK